MAMRMPPQTAVQPAVPDVNRGSLIFFLGAALVVVNFYITNGKAASDLIFFKGSGPQPLTGMFDAGLQLVGVGILVLMAQYGGEGAGSFALVFVIALWLLFLVVHVGGLMGPEKPAPVASSANPSGGNIHQAIQ